MCHVGCCSINTTNCLPATRPCSLMPAGIFYCWLSRLTFSLAALRTSVDRMLESYSYSERPPSVFQATHTAEVHPGASITAQIDTIYMAVAIRITRTSQALDGVHYSQCTLVLPRTPNMQHSQARPSSWTTCRDSSAPLSASLTSQRGT